jgi:hypothetical protein
MGMTLARRQWGLVLAVGLISGLVCWLAYRLPPASTSDFELVWVGARALLSGADPYAVVPTTGTHYPLYYPLTAIVVGLPFAALPFYWARLLWAAVSGVAFAWAAFRYGRGLPAALLSANFLNAEIQGQWSPLLIAAAVLPAFSWVLAAKPSIGGALFAAFPTRRAVIGGLALLGISLALSPTWPVRWVESLGASVHVSPILRPGGVILLLALVRWKQPEARLLAALACVPQIIGLYDTLPLFLIPRTRWQGYALAGLSYVAAFGQVAAVPRLPGMTVGAVVAARWPFMFACLYLPALVIVLLPRPVEARGRLEGAADSLQGM